MCVNAFFLCIRLWLVVLLLLYNCDGNFALLITLLPSVSAYARSFTIAFFFFAQIKANDLPTWLKLCSPLFCFRWYIGKGAISCPPHWISRATSWPWHLRGAIPCPCHQTKGGGGSDAQNALLCSRNHHSPCLNAPFVLHSF